MIITKDIYYQENFQVGAFLFKTYGTTKEFTEESEKQQAWDEAKKDVLEQFKKDNSHLVSNNTPIFQNQELPSQQIEKALTPIESIYKCQTLDELIDFNYLSTTDKLIKKAYDLQTLKIKKNGTVKN